jgi:hypothetical protein
MLDRIRELPYPAREISDRIQIIPDLGQDYRILLRKLGRDPDSRYVICERRFLRCHLTKQVGAKRNLRVLGWTLFTRGSDRKEFVICLVL